MPVTLVFNILFIIDEADIIKYFRDSTITNKAK